MASNVAQKLIAAHLPAALRAGGEIEVANRTKMRRFGSATDPPPDRWR